MRTEILDYDGPVLHHGLLLPQQGIAVLERLLGDRVEDADAVEVGRLGGPRDLLLRVLDRRRVRELNGRRETPEPFPGPVGDFEGEAHPTYSFNMSRGPGE